MLCVVTVPISSALGVGVGAVRQEDYKFHANLD